MTLNQKYSFTRPIMSLLAFVLSSTLYAATFECSLPAQTSVNRFTIAPLEIDLTLSEITEISLEFNFLSAGTAGEQTSATVIRSGRLEKIEGGFFGANQTVYLFQSTDKDSDLVFVNLLIGAKLPLGSQVRFADDQLFLGECSFKE
jgi:hypothetical protein